MNRISLTAALSALLLLNGSPLAQSTTRTTAAQTAAPQAFAPLITTANVRQTILSNGLTVLTKEVRGAPVVSVQVFYKIGSRNEAAGVNGIAHQLEHMMFKGTVDRPVQFGRLLGALGADFNAFTAYDQTAYHETVQREKVGAVLALEADRMVNAQIDEAKLAGERRVVLSEIEGDENDPQYRLSRAVQQAAFPGSPYGLTVGGTRKDIEGFSADKVRAYYRKYYSPEYATLVIVGDFQTDAMLAQVRKTFGGLGKPGTQPVKTSVPLVGARSEATLGSPAAKAPIVLKEPGATPLLSAVYPLPDINNPDTAALKVLDYVLLSGRSSKLYTALFESGLAAGGGTSPNQFLNGGWYEVNFTPAPGKTVEQLDAALLAAIADVRQHPVSAVDVQQAVTQIRASEVLGSVSVDAQAGSLGMDATSAGDYRYTDRFLAALTRVTPADVQRVAQKYLADGSRTVGYFQPTAVQAGAGGSAPTTATQEAFNAGPAVDPAEVARYLPAFPAPGSASVTLPEQLKLPNGLTVFLLRDAGTPTVALSASVRAGREFDTDAGAGLVDLVAGNLLSGTTTRSAVALSRLLDGVGAQLSPSASRFGVSIGGASLSADLPTLIEGLSDILQHATFPADQFKLTQARAIQAVIQADDSPGSVAQKVFRKTVYPAGNPWQVFSTQTTLAGLTQPDLTAFYKAHYRPDTTVITLVGNFDPAGVKALLIRKFGGWQASGSAPRVNYPLVGKPSGIVRANPPLPGKTQAVTYLGYQSIERADPRYYASLVLNQVLGGDTLSSRLGTELRDNQGLTYGVSSGFSAGRVAGPFIVSMQTNPADTEKAIQAALALIGKVRDEGLSETEVSTAKNTLTSEFTVGLSNPAALASAFTGFYSDGVPLDELRLYSQKVGAVTLAQVNAAARSLLDPQNIVIVTAGPAGAGK